MAKVLIVDDSPTVLRVIEFVLHEAGHDVICLDHGSEVVVAASKDRPDLLLLDFAMPGMNGYDACRKIGESPELETIPIAIMSTRGDPVGERFVREMGIVDHITKRFAPEALPAMVQHLLHKAGEVSPHTRARRARSMSRSSSPADNAAAITIAAALAAKLAPGPTVQTTEACWHFIRAGLGLPGLAGELATIGLAEILQLLSLQRQSGFFTVRRKDEVVRIAFKEGAVRLVTGENTGREFLLGSILVREGFMRQQDLDEFLRQDEVSHGLLGSQVVSQGYVSRDDLHGALRKQSAELVYELLRWGHGRFEFYSQEHLPNEVLEFEFGLGIDELLMEGLRRVDEWRLIETVLPNLDLTVHPVASDARLVGPQRLTQEEQAVLDAVDGKRNVQAIIEVVGLGTFEVARLLYRLASARVVRVDHPNQGVAPG